MNSEHISNSIYQEVELVEVAEEENEGEEELIFSNSDPAKDLEEGGDDSPSDEKQLEEPPSKSQHFIQVWLERLGFVDHQSKKDDPDDIVQIPEMSHWQLFLIFLWFGCRAFGGPVAQIAMMKQELVTEKKWISVGRFNRVYSVYQILPGPEATELACYFGYLSKGRFGALLGGLGFVLPGCSVLLFLAWLYKNYGLSSSVVNRSFTCVQIAVSAMIFRATYKLGEGTILTKAKEIHWEKGFLCLFAFLTSVIKLNFFITLGVCGLIHVVFETSLLKTDLQKQVLGYSIAAVTIGFYVLYCELNGVPDGNLVGGSSASGYTNTDYRSLFVLGLIAGCVTFGGAYTTLPFIYSVAVTTGGWLTDRQFLDAIAITNMLPTPLVSFVIIVGFIGHSVGGAILMCIGIFLPAFSFTIIGHEIFQAVVDNKYVEPFLDGIASAVIGLLTFTCFQFLKSVIREGLDAVVFLLAFSSLFTFTNKYTAPITLLVAAIAGQVLY
jgi:putative chromate ion transporter